MRNRRATITNHHSGPDSWLVQLFVRTSGDSWRQVNSTIVEGLSEAMRYVRTYLETGYY